MEPFQPGRASYVRSPSHGGMLARLLSVPRNLMAWDGESCDCRTPENPSARCGHCEAKQARRRSDYLSRINTNASDNHKLSTVLDTVRGSGAELQENRTDSENTLSPKGDKLLWDLDCRLLPSLLVMALLQGFDKNVSHANTMGMSAQLSIDSNEYSTLLMTFYIGFILSTICLVAFAKHLRNVSMHFLCLAALSSGVSTAAIALSTTFRLGTAYSWIATIRFVQGLCEGAFTATTVFYLMQFYSQPQLSSRMTIFYLVPSVSSLLGAFYASGLIRTTPNRLYNWQYFYIGEGSLTVVASIVSYVILPADPSKLFRVSFDGVPSPMQSRFYIQERVTLKKIEDLLRNPSAVFWLAIDACLGVPMTLILLYLPQMIMRTGFDAPLANLLTPAPYLSSIFILIFLIPRIDASKLLYAMIFIFIIQFIGYLLYRLVLLSSNPSSRWIAYAATFLMSSGVGTTNIIAAKQFGPMVTDDEQRLFLNTLGLCLINATGILTSWVFRSSNFHADEMTIAFVAGGLIISLMSWWYMRRKSLSIDVEEKSGSCSSSV